MCLTPVLFTNLTADQSSGRIEVRLGSVRIGEILPGVAVGATQCVAWRLWLPEVSPRWRRAAGLVEAQGQIDVAVADWIETAGLAPAEHRHAGIRVWRPAAAPDGRAA